MATGVNSWSTTPASNATADSSINWAEGQAPSSVNDSARAMMARIADWRDSLNGSNATTGGTTAYVLTSDQSFAALAAGLEVSFQINATNTGTTTLNVDSLGAKPLRSAANVEVVAGALKIGAVYRATYFTSNSGEWLLHDCTPTIIATDQVVTASIVNSAVTYAKLQNTSTGYRVIGRNGSGAGAYNEVSAEQLLNWIVSTRGDIITRGASDPQRLALGPADYVLTSDGTDAVWALPSRKLVATLSGTNQSELGSTSCFDSTFKFYELELVNVFPVSSSTEVRLQIYSGGSYRTSGYISTTFSQYPGSNTVYAPTTHIGLAGANNDTSNALPGVTAKLRFIDPSAAARCLVHGSYGYKYGGANQLVSGHVNGMWDTAAAVTGCRLIAGSGNITGEARIYGYN